MAKSSSSDDIPTVTAVPRSSSLPKLKQKKLMMHFKKIKNLGPLRLTPVNLTAHKTLQEAIDETRMQATDKTRMLQRMSVQKINQAAVNSPAMLRAKEVQSKLPAKYPSFVKFMLKSHVTGGFWLSFPKSFCDKHMPKKDETFSLVGEDVKEKEHNAKYLVEKNGLSGGWRGFAIAHKLVAGDVLVFQLIKSRKFKVYIVKARESAEDDNEDVKNDIQMVTADEPCKSETQSEQSDSTGDCLDSDPAATWQKTGDCLDSEPPATSQETGNGFDSERTASLQETGNGLDSGTVATLQQSDKSDDMECTRLAKSIVEFKEVKGFESFNIIIDGLIIDSEIPIHLRYRYYELCCNQKKILHDGLVKGLNFKLAAAVISETVNIADAIKAAKLTGSLEILQSWDKTLKAFEVIGMRVGFLRNCLDKLICLLYEQQEIVRSKKLQQAQLEAEIRDLEGKVSKRCEGKKHTGC